MTRQPPTRDLNKISNQLLLSSIRTLAKKERDLTLTILQHLQEVERRSVFALLGYSSLFMYCTNELNYSEGAAQRRISSMRLLKELPEFRGKVSKGRLSLTTLSKAQVFIRNQKIKSKDEKIKLLSCLENKSSREVERELITRAKEPLKLKHEKLQRVSAQFSELRILIDDNTLEDITELKNLLSHSHPHASIKEIFKVSLKIALKELRPKAPKNVVASNKAAAPHNAVASMDTVALENNLTPLKNAQPSAPKDVPPLSSAPPPPKDAAPPKSTLPPAAALNKKATNQPTSQITITKYSKRSRYISRELKRQVWARDKGECSYIHPESKRKCGSKHGLEFDHIVPFAVGGESTRENLRLRCRVHNQLAAITSFGHEKMAKHIWRLK